jgi:hypothetical protein
MLVQIFFATSRTYQPGDIVRLAAGAQAPHLATATPEWLTMEVAFEAARPAGHPSRMTSKFACATAEDCLAYYLPQGGIAGKRVYRAYMDDPVSAPMALTRRGQVKHNVPATLVAIAQEYWAKQLRPWQYLEYLAPAMEIIDEVDPLPDAMMVAGATFRFQNDLMMATQLWP